MLKGIILASLLFTTLPAYADWQLPSGKRWHTPTGLCTPGKGNVEGCAFGPENATRPDAYAYFRVCRTRLEQKPFLVVDFVKRNFTFDMGDGTPVITSPFPQGAVSHTSNDMGIFFLRVEKKRGSCLKDLEV